jgi:hypothetical protein
MFVGHPFVLGRFARQPTGTGRPTAQIAGGAGELHLNVCLGLSTVPTLSDTETTFEFAVGSFNRVATLHAYLIFGCATE